MNHPDSRDFAEQAARTMYANMRQAGFSDEMIIYVTAKMISELSVSIRERDRAQPSMQEASAC